MTSDDIKKYIQGSSTPVLQDKLAEYERKAEETEYGSRDKETLGDLVSLMKLELVGRKFGVNDSD